MKRTTLLIFLGLGLIAFSLAWFLTPLSEAVVTALRGPELPTRGLGSPAGAVDLLNTTLNAINTVCGAAGLYLAARGYRLQAPKD